MKKLLFAAILSTMSVASYANQFDTYKCWGNNLKLVLVLDWFGSGVEQSVNGVYMGKKISYKPVPGYHPKKIDPKYQYSWYQDPNSTTLVRMSNPDLTTIDDPTYYGTLIVDGKEVRFECENPAPNF